MPECSDLSAPALIVVSVSGRTWFGTLSFCNHEDHPVTLWLESDNAAVVEPLRWFAAFL